mmetsp:Transcript_31767/g.38385  ORF Transcript_31767/g.38385 Transcript_31767/m.38385 type:complete len:203 (+) Transcript_31767:843-1451(+)
MLIVVGVVLVRAKPLVGCEMGSRLHDTRDLFVKILKHWSVTGGLDTIAAIEVIVRERHLQERTLHNVCELRSTSLDVLGGTTLNLVGVDSNPGYLTPGCKYNIAHGTTNTAPGVQNALSRLQTDLLGNLDFVPNNGSVKTFALITRCEVERLSPAILVEVCDETVESVHKLWGVELALTYSFAVILLEELVIGVDAVLEVTP